MSATNHPDYDRAVKTGRKLWEQKSAQMPESLQRDYLRIVSQNPNNVPGLPAFYPPDNPTVSLNMSNELTVERIERAAVESFIDKHLTRTIYLHCSRCDVETEHGISPSQCFCSRCGRQNGFHNAS
jgi:hypothetical protein